MRKRDNWPFESEGLGNAEGVEFSFGDGEVLSSGKEVLTPKPELFRVATDNKLLSFDANVLDCDSPRSISVAGDVALEAGVLPMSVSEMLLWLVFSDKIAVSLTGGFVDPSLRDG
jgi:hypothetical protein